MIPPVTDNEVWLGLERPWAELDVTRAYRKLAKICHPDTGIYGTHGEEIFKSLVKARTRLLEVLATMPGGVMPKAPQARSKTPPHPEPEPPPKRKRGRPRKKPQEEPKEPRKRGRPRKEPQEQRTAKEPTYTLGVTIRGLTRQQMHDIVSLLPGDDLSITVLNE